MNSYRTLKEFHTYDKNMLSYIKIIVIILLSVFYTSTKAQSRMEVGFRGGISYYMGDLNPQNQFNNPGVQAGALIRYALSDRIAFKATGSYVHLRLSYPDNNVLFPVGEIQREYPKNLSDLTAEIELNFLSYDHPFIKKTKFTPYLSLGLGTTIYKRLDTESENSTKEMVFILSLPIGIGFKYKISDWIRIGAEWTFRKTFVDDLDYTVAGEDLNAYDPYGFGKSGKINNTDVYSFAGVMVTFNLIRRKTECKSGF